MSAADMEPQEQPAKTGEPGGVGERVARLVLVGVLLLAMWGIVVVLSETAYVIVGILCTLGWQRARRWLVRRRGGAHEGDAAPDAEERRESLPELLHRLADPHVFLADIAAEHHVSTETARAVLESHGIRVRRAVRSGQSTGVGVHRDDIPPLPQPLSHPPVGSVDQGQPTNRG